VARPLALAAAIAAALLAVSGSGGAATQQTPKRGGTVVVASVAQEPACLNPFDLNCVPGSSEITALRIVNRVLLAPFAVDSSFRWREQLVSDVAYTTKPPFTLTYHIRPEARWSDGVPITAADFVFTHEALKRYALESNLHRTIVRSVRALDRKTARVVLRERVAAWRGLFGPILPKHALANENLLTVWRDGIVNPRTGEPIGSGPFLIGTWDRGKQIALRRNPRYWGLHPAYVDRLVLRFAVNGGTLVNGFRSGGVDLVEPGYPPTFFADLNRQPGVRTIRVRSVGMEHFALRLGPGGHPALRNKLVRQALAFGLDRQALADVAVGDLRPRQAQRDSIVLPTYSPHYRPNWQYRRRPAEARGLLERAGYTRGIDAVYVCAGQRLSLTFFAPVIQGSVRPRVVELAQRQLRDVGVEVVPRYGPNQAILGQIAPSGDFDVVLFSWTQDSPNYRWKDVFGTGGNLNYTGYRQRLVTSDLDQAERILDADRQAAALNRADLQMAKDVPAIPLYEFPQWAAMRSGLRNFTPAGIDTLAGAENWWLER
jgi:ABC-type transport system substrate-binding protein